MKEIVENAWDAYKDAIAKYPGAAGIAIVLGPLLVWIF
jgi:hypothetical protein